jgi:hypothetical protein
VYPLRNWKKMKLTRPTFSRIALRFIQRICLWHSWTACLRTESLLQPFGLQDLRIFLRPIFFSLRCDENLCVFEQVPHNWRFEDGHHRIHSECGPCYTEHGLREHSSACQYISGDWRGTLWTLLVTFCIVIIRCTETSWSPCRCLSTRPFSRLLIHFVSKLIHFILF